MNGNRPRRGRRGLPEPRLISSFVAVAVALVGADRPSARSVRARSRRSTRSCTATYYWWFVEAGALMCTSPASTCANALRRLRTDEALTCTFPDSNKAALMAIDEGVEDLAELRRRGDSTRLTDEELQPFVEEVRRELAYARQILEEAVPNPP